MFNLIQPKMLSHNVILEVLSSHIWLVVTAVLDNIYVDGMIVGMGVRGQTNWRRGGQGTERLAC